MNVQTILRATMFVVILLMIFSGIFFMKSGFGEGPLDVNDHHEHQEQQQQHNSPVNDNDHDKKPPRKSNDNNNFRNNIHFITVQTNPSPGWCRNMRSAVRTGITVTNLGWGQHYAHSARPKWIVSFLESQTKWSYDDVILFSDGADTMFTGVDADTIRRRFERIAQDDVRGKRDFVMFNAEANCYHQQLFESKPWGVNKGRCLAAYKRFDPSRHTKWRYLNAGAWIATKRAAIWLFSNVSRKLDADRNLWCDQSVIGGMMLAEGSAAAVAPWNRLILLDTKNTIFLPTYHLRVRRDVCSANAASDYQVFSKPSSLVLCHSKRAPAILHFNGRSGNSGIEAERRAQLPPMSSAKLSSPLQFWDTTHGAVVTSATLEEKCPKYVAF